MHENVPNYARRVAQLIDRLARLTRDLQYVDGLNPAQWEALRFLSRANRYSRTPGALAEFLGTTKGTVSQTLIVLEQKGYVTRVRSDADRRVVRLELTEPGETMLQNDPIVAIEAAAEQLDEELGGSLVRGLSRLLHDLQSRHGLKEFGVCQECTLLCVRGGERRSTAERECGLTGEGLTEVEQTRLCVNFRPN